MCNNVCLSKVIELCGGWICFVGILCRYTHILHKTVCNLPWDGSKKHCFDVNVQILV